MENSLKEEKFAGLKTAQLFEVRHNLSELKRLANENKLAEAYSVSLNLTKNNEWFDFVTLILSNRMRKIVGDGLVSLYEDSLRFSSGRFDVRLSIGKEREINLIDKDFEIYDGEDFEKSALDMIIDDVMENERLHEPIALYKDERELSTLERIENHKKREIKSKPGALAKTSQTYENFVELAKEHLADFEKQGWEIKTVPLMD